jgi:hypothetical protein
MNRDLLAAARKCEVLNAFRLRVAGLGWQNGPVLALNYLRP